MRVIAVSEYGATPSVMDLPLPEPGPGEVLVKLVAAGMNPVDWKIADGMLKDSVDAQFPLVLGADGAGVVEAVGPDVGRFAAGDQVFGQFRDLTRGCGSYAEYAVVDQDAPLARMPQGLIYTQAAGVPMAAMTGYTMVREAGLDVGKTVLIVGATGGVGQFAVQFAADVGAHVIATAHPDMDAEMRRLGAAETVDYGRADIGEQVLANHDGIDAIIDLVSGPPEVDALTGLLRPGGAYVSSINAVNPDKMASQQLTGVNIYTQGTPELLATIADMLDASRIRVAVAREVPLEDAPAAVAAGRQGGARGKTVIRI
ncbi:Zinc-type alcohol dehydrogenase-like protein [Actinomadura rubteroloni]|uniref:Zinc-type alcohol dehydrogenase-like protein n=1 Tax=Actinomadura rubteroloni TaxID=1926885 RepID=A0A2P4UQ23_9ACTN|nr:Zinc-type alcohol dehydrogenase-like protein [Actinomadura rubteroloni]